MQKKHSFSPNHKVVTDSKHNHHPFGAPTTASQGQPPESVGGGGGGGGGNPGGESAPADGGPSGGMDGMNFCNGGMKYADGGDTDSVFEKAGEAVSRVIPGGGNDYDPNSKKGITPLAAGDKDEPYAGKGGKQQTDTNMSIADKAG
jgi:hypothetical protein